MRLKRILALSTAAVLAAAMLTGCPWEPDAPAPSEPSGSSSRPSHDDEDDAETPSEPDEPDKPDEPGEDTEAPENPDEGGEDDEPVTTGPKATLENGVLTITGGSDTLTKDALKELLPEGTDKTAITELDLSASGYTSIGEWAFSSCNNLTSICLPDSLTSIGGAAFSSCANLTSVTLPDSLTRIEGGAFHGCTNLQSVYLPDNLTKIGSYAFNGCTSLQAIRVGEGIIADGAEIGYGAFSDIPGPVTIYYPSEWGEESEYNSNLNELKSKLNFDSGVTVTYEPRDELPQTTPELPDGAKELLEMARLFGL